MLAAARQSMRVSVSVISIRQVEGSVATARWWRVPHSVGLPGILPSAAFSSVSMQGHA